uniref:Uncharacterized protein n=1 Tax=Panagrolaimus sp. ES5 TaxID=591445 RepID=A0AC34GS92_9BILA
MGSSYSAIPNADERDLLAMAVKEPQTMCRSLTFSDKHPNVRHPVHTDTINCIGAVRPGMVLTGSSDKSIVLNNVDTGECVIRWRGHTDSVTNVLYKQSQTRHYVLSGSRDTTIRLWLFNQNTPCEIYDSHKLTVTTIANLEDNLFASGSRDTSVKIFDISRKEPLMSKTINRNLVTHISRIPNSSLICQTSEDRIMKLYDTRNLEVVHEFPVKGHIQNHCNASNDGLYAIASSGGSNGDGCEITLYDLRQRKELRGLRGHEESVRCAVFLPQNITCKNIILSVGDDKTVRLWTKEDSKCIWREQSPTGSILTSCFGFADGNIVVAGANATFAHLKMNGRAGVPFLHCISLQSTNCMPSNSRQSFG